MIVQQRNMDTIQVSDTSVIEKSRIRYESSDIS